MASVREDVLAFRHFPVSHWRMLWSTNLLEQDEHWETEGRRMACLDSMAAIPAVPTPCLKQSGSRR
jgi:transposase-like protein